MTRLASGLLAFLVALAPLTTSADQPAVIPAQATAAPAGGVVGDGTPISCNEANFTAVLAAGGTVTFNCGGPKTITLTSGKLITQATTIDGGHTITLSASGAMRFFEVGAASSLTLRGIVLDGAPGVGAHGGAIYNPGRLTIEDSTIQNSSTDSGHAGGAIFSTGPLTVTHSTFKGNSAGDAGAIFLNSPNARATISDSEFSQNRALTSTTRYGGAIWVGFLSSLTLDNVNLNLNSAMYGGALFLSPSAVVTGASTEDSDYILVMHNNTAVRAGGAIFNQGGTLLLTNANIIFNQTVTATSSYGGGIFNVGKLNLADSVLNANTSDNGGGLAVDGRTTHAAVRIDRSIVESNIATADGGGLWANGVNGAMTVTESAIDGNLASGSGAGLWRASLGLAVERSSFTHNTAYDDGGGLFIGVALSTPLGANGYVAIRNTTISTNTADHGGAIFRVDLLDLSSVTVKDNQEGIYNSTAAGMVMRGSVLDNIGPNCPGFVVAADHGFNFVTDASCGPPASGSPPLLGPLTNDPNGVTSYHLPLAGSPLINQGAPDCSPLDQRRASRPDRCDIGAVEFGGLLAELWLPLVRK